MGDFAQKITDFLIFGSSVVEHRTENPGVRGSTPRPGTNFFLTSPAVVSRAPPKQHLFVNSSDLYISR